MEPPSRLSAGDPSFSTAAAPAAEAAELGAVPAAVGAPAAASTEGAAAKIAGLKERIKQATDAGDYDRLPPLIQQIKALETAAGAAAPAAAPASAAHVSAAVAAATKRLAKSTKDAQKRRKRKARDIGEAGAAAAAGSGGASGGGDDQAIFEPAVVEQLLRQAVPTAAGGRGRRLATDQSAPVYMAAVMEYLTAEMVEA